MFQGTGLSDLIVTGAIPSESVQSISPAQGNVYEYIDLIPARYTTIEQASILFTVRQSWLDEHNMTPQNIVLYSLTNSTWTGLPTLLLKTENGRLYLYSTILGLIAICDCRWHTCFFRNAAAHTRTESPYCWYTCAAIHPPSEIYPGLHFSTKTNTRSAKR